MHIFFSGWGSIEATEITFEERAEDNQFKPDLGTNTENVEQNIDEGKLHEVEVREELKRCPVTTVQILTN